MMTALVATSAASVRSAVVIRGTGGGAQSGFYAGLLAFSSAVSHPVVVEVVLGEQFSVEMEDGIVFLVHPQWSLLGSGRDLAEARQHLLDEARELAVEMADDDERLLSDQAKRMREFVKGVK